jgi:hypothetical protein
MQPSCSHYGAQAIETYGLLPGLLMTTDRLMRDHGRARHQYPRDEHGHPVDPPQANALFAARHTPIAELDAGRAAREQDEAAAPRPGSPGQLERLAGDLVDRGEHERAGVEYRRLLLVSEDPASRARALRGLALALSLQGRHDEALHEAEGLPARERRAVRAWLLQRAGRLEEALLEAPLERGEDRLYAGLLALEARRGALAREHFATLPDAAASLLGRRVDEFEGLTHKHGWLAGTMSAVLPGSGQFYAGSRADGVVAFLTNAVLIGTTALALREDEDVTAGVVGFVALGFWTGNVYGAVNAAHRHDERQRERFLRQLEGDVRQAAPGWGITPRPDGGALGLTLRF